MSVDVDVAFVERLARAFTSARGNDRFVKTRDLAALTSAWVAARALSPSSVPAFVIDADSGLPPWLVWAALLAERELGQSMGPSSSSSPPPGDDARARLWRREQAARSLAAAPALSAATARADVVVAVRRVEKTQTLLSLVLDRASAAGVFVRVCVDVWVSSSSSSSVTLDDDRAGATAGLRELLSLSTHLPAPALLVQAASLDGVVVDRVSRGVVGPCASVFGGPRVDPARANTADDFALVVQSEEVARDIAATACDDVFAVDDLAAMMRALPKSLQAFKAYRTAKAVASPSSSSVLKARAKQAAKKTVVVELR